MGVFDAVKSLFGSGSDEDSERDASADDPATSETAAEQSRDASERTADEAATETTQPTTNQDTAVDSSEDTDAATGQADDTEAGDPFEYAGESDGLEDVDELETDTASDETEPEAVGTDEPDPDDSDEEEKISWEETGFEQLTTELVDDDEEAEDASDFITEAEPDRQQESEFDTVSAIPDAEDDDSDTADVSASESTAPEPTAEESAETDADERVESTPETVESEGTDTAPESTTPPEQRLPLDEEEAEAVTEGLEDGPDVDVPEDSKRAELISEATDLVEFWGEYDLDFTVDSLTRLDELLDEQWEHDRFEDAEYGGEDYDSEVFTGLVKQIGAYLGEIFVRVHDGEWVKQEGVGWIVDVPAGEDVEVAGAAVTVFHIARQCLTSEMTVAGKYDGLAQQLGLEPLAGASEADIEAAMPDTATVSEADRQSVDETATRLQESAEDLAERWPDYDLDFSIESLSRLEELLAAELDDERFVDAELGDETDQDSVLLTAHAVGVGGYLGEVLRRERDGEWLSKGNMLLVVETPDGPEELDPIDIAVDCIRGERSLTEAVPDAA